MGFAYFCVEVLKLRLLKRSERNSHCLVFPTKSMSFTKQKSHPKKGIISNSNEFAFSSADPDLDSKSTWFLLYDFRHAVRGGTNSLIFAI